MGWIRANILYEKATRLPEPGSPMETLFILLWKMRQDIEFQKVRALMQGLVSMHQAEEKAAMEAFDEFRQAFYPATEQKEEEKSRDFRAALLREVHRGPIKVAPKEDFSRRNMRTGLAKGEKEMARHKVLQEIGKLERIDLLQNAKKRPRGAS